MVFELPKAGSRYKPSLPLTPIAFLGNAFPTKEEPFKPFQVNISTLICYARSKRFSQAHMRALVLNFYEKMTKSPRICFDLQKILASYTMQFLKKNF
jgi:hypothetical protein